MQFMDISSVKYSTLSDFYDWSQNKMEEIWSVKELSNKIKAAIVEWLAGNFIKFV